MEVDNMMNVKDVKNVIDKRKLTWSKPNGTWGLKNYDIHDVPKELYGPLYKLHNYEKTGLSPEEVEDLKERQQLSRYCGEEKQLIEAMAEEIENCYGRETELSERARDYLDKTDYDGGWIPCSERLPEEYDSIFAKFKGTDKWNDFMFEKISDEVNATVEFEDGKRKTMTLYTIDGKWKTGIRIVKFKVIAWQPLPEPYKGEEEK